MMGRAARRWLVPVGVLPSLLVGCGEGTDENPCPYVSTGTHWDVSGAIRFDDRTIGLDSAQIQATEGVLACSDFRLSESEDVGRRRADVTCQIAEGGSVRLTITAIDRLGPPVAQPLDSVVSLDHRFMELGIVNISSTGDPDPNCWTSTVLSSGEFEEQLAVGVIEPDEEVPNDFRRIRRLSMSFEHQPTDTDCSTAPEIVELALELSVDASQVWVEQDPRCKDFG